MAALIDDARLLEGLTDAQRAAVVRTEGPVLILAAAGSGKTRVITRRIAYLLAQGVPAWQIMALTFTNKAAGEMRDRVHALLTPEGDTEPPPALVRGLTITTFHSLCARLLRRYAEEAAETIPGWQLRGNYSIYDADDQLALMKQELKALELSTSNWPPRSMLSSISAAKNELKDAQAYEREARSMGGFMERTTAKVFEAYDRALRKANAVDFDDLMLLTVKLLQGCDRVREEVQRRFRYLMIDEYQDTNHAQFMLATLLCIEHANEPSSSGVPIIGASVPSSSAQPASASRGPNICVVGDPDQSIYGWRGADIRNILEFEERYPKTEVIALGQNFRSTPHILATADALIRNNKQRKHKDLFTAIDAGQKPEVMLCRSEHHEADLVLDWLKVRGIEEGVPWNECAVFYRNNALSRVMEDALRKSSIPYIIARGTAFYQREEVKDGLAYLRLIANPADDISLGRIINKPARKIGKSTIEQITQHAAKSGATVLGACREASEIGLSNAAVSATERFVALVDGWTGAGTFLGQDVASSLGELVERVIRESGLERHYRAKASRATGEPDEDKVANLEELINAAIEFEEGYDSASDVAQEANADAAPPLLAMLRAFLESVSLVADADRIDPARGAVTLMTLHAAKGLEFHAVAMIGLEEGLLPGMRALESESELEEERRLAFVGITRARERLLITSAKYRTHRGLRERTIPSRFLNELPGEQITVSDQSDAWDGEGDVGDPFGGWSPPAQRKPKRIVRGNDDVAHIDEFEVDQRPPEERSMASSMGLTKKKTELTPGDIITHPQFGRGVIERVMGFGMNRRATIAFEDLGTKTLVLQYARLRVVGRMDEDVPF
ncbi:MAG: UvrD-helicase domain-containing protein [Phycisphaerales bacterium]|nr:UvrD-helicase domain-containing protein [Phycisphaerales bacterium]